TDSDFDSAFVKFVYSCRASLSVVSGMLAVPHLRELTDSASQASDGELLHQRRGRLLALQHEVTAAANSALSFDAALKQTLPRICYVFGWPVAHAFVMAEQELILLPTAVWHFDDQVGLQRLAGVRAEPLDFNPAAEDIAVRSLESSEAPRALL